MVKNTSEYKRVHIFELWSSELSLQNTAQVLAEAMGSSPIQVWSFWCFKFTTTLACVASRFKQLKASAQSGEAAKTKFSLSQARHGFGACYRGFPAFLAHSNCLKTAKLSRLQLLKLCT